MTTSYNSRKKNNITPERRRLRNRKKRGLLDLTNGKIIKRRMV